MLRSLSIAVSILCESFALDVLGELIILSTSASGISPLCNGGSATSSEENIGSKAVVVFGSQRNSAIEQLNQLNNGWAPRQFCQGLFQRLPFISSSISFATL